MKKRITIYREIMERSRRLGMLGASLILLCAVYELWNIHNALSLAAIEVWSDDLWWSVFRDVFFFVLIGTASIGRFAALFYIMRLPYALVAASWALPAIVFISYWLTARSPQYTNCGPNEICFGLYDMMSVINYVHAAGVLFFFISVLRALATVVRVEFAVREKLH